MGSTLVGSSPTYLSPTVTPPQPNTNRQGKEPTLRRDSNKGPHSGRLQPCHFYPSLIFAGKAKSLPSEWSQIRASTLVGSSLTYLSPRLQPNICRQGKEPTLRVELNGGLHSDQAPAFLSDHYQSLTPQPNFFRQYKEPTLRVESNNGLH